MKAENAMKFNLSDTQSHSNYRYKKVNWSLHTNQQTKETNKPAKVEVFISITKFPFPHDNERAERSTG